MVGGGTEGNNITQQWRPVVQDVCISWYRRRAVEVRIYESKWEELEGTSMRMEDIGVIKIEIIRTEDL
jgi:hypothetical protein